MNRIALILSLVIVSAGAIFAGNYHWKQSIEKTTEKAEATLHAASANGANPARSTTVSSAAGGTSVSQPADNPAVTTPGSQTKNGQPADGKQPNNGQTGNANYPSNTNSSAGNHTGASGSSSTPASGNGTTTSGSTGSGTGSQKQTVEQIKNKYRSLFTELESAETSKIDQLVIAAKADYVGKKASKSDITAKYQVAAKQMEQSSDRAFYVLYQNLQYDLDKNGYSLNEAQEFQHTYNTKKQEHLNRIISEVRGF